MARNGTVCHAGNSRIAARLRPANPAQAMSSANGRSRRRPRRGQGAAAGRSRGPPTSGTGTSGWCRRTRSCVRTILSRPAIREQSGKSTPSLPPRPIQVNRRPAGLDSVGRVADALPGRPSPLGATPRDGGINFAVASGVAEAAEVCLFSDSGEESRFRLPDYDGGAWHGFVPGDSGSGLKGSGQAYGFRVHGPYDAARGLRCNPAKLLLDPYARALRGEVSFGPEVFDYDWDDHDAPSSLDSAGHVPLSLVTDAAFDWGSDTPLRRDFADTVIYEVHVKGFTMRHPGVPPELQGTYAGLAHDAVRSYFCDLGVT